MHASICVCDYNELMSLHFTGIVVVQHYLILVTLKNDSFTNKVHSLQYCLYLHWLGFIIIVNLCKFDKHNCHTLHPQLLVHPKSVSYACFKHL